MAARPLFLEANFSPCRGNNSRASGRFAQGLHLFGDQATARGAWKKSCWTRPASTSLRLAFRPVSLGFRNIGAEPPLSDREPGARHQILVVGEIDFGEPHHRQYLARLYEMAPIGARIVAGHRRRRQGIDRPRIVGETRVAQVEAAPAGEDEPMPP